MEKICGFLFLLLGGSAIFLMIYSSIWTTLHDVEDERVHELAEKLYREWVRNTRFRIVQRLEIKDETKEVRS